ncbi:Uncharacterised protein [Mycobacteroides abscessus subsp. abscessus]|nr:Uncharacterised protein [Mycobacteroides abscessus subsp. abscessus]
MACGQMVHAPHQFDWDQHRAIPGRARGLHAADHGEFDLVCIQDIVAAMGLAVVVHPVRRMESVPDFQARR